MVGVGVGGYMWFWVRGSSCCWLGCGALLVLGLVYRGASGFGFGFLGCVGADSS